MPIGAAFVTAEGRIRVVGYNDMREILEPLAALFSEAHPAIRFEFDLRGTRYAPQALASGSSAFAPMGAAFTPGQLAEYRRQQKQDPACFRIAHASPDPAALSGPLAVFVNEENPLASLTLEKLRQIFAGGISRWGEAGLSGTWSERPVTLYGLRVDTALRHEFSTMVMDGQPLASSVNGLAQSTEVVARVAADTGGIGFAAAMRIAPDVRLVPLSAGVRDTPVLPTPADLMGNRYPLDRFLYICTARPMPEVAREFIRLALASEGQSIVAATAQGYIPLLARDAAAESAGLSLHSGGCPAALTSAGAQRP